MHFIGHVRGKTFNLLLSVWAFAASAAGHKFIKMLLLLIS